MGNSELPTEVGELLVDRLALLSLAAVAGYDDPITFSRDSGYPILIRNAASLMFNHTLHREFYAGLFKEIFQRFKNWRTQALIENEFELRHEFVYAECAA
jgi:hypothetical protein